MRKIFTLLFTALMSVGMYAETTVTWDSNTISSISMRDGGQSFTKDGVTLTLLDGRIAGTRDWRGNSVEASFKFSTSLGNFTRIEITATINGLEGSGWTQTSPGAVWTGDANETTFGIYFKNVSQIVFTIEEPALAVAHTLQLHVNDAAMGSVAVTNLLGSDIIDNGDGTYAVPEGAEVTLLATPNEGYEFTGWKASNTICDFTECEFVALPTVDNPLTFDMNAEVAIMAEFAAVAPQPEPQPAASDTITWDYDFCSGVMARRDEGEYLAWDNSKDGITVTYGGNDDYDGMEGGYIELYGTSESKMIFSSTVGDISKIEVYYLNNEAGSAPADWIDDATNSKFVWEGTPAASVDMKKGDAQFISFAIDHIVFIVESQGGTTAVENVQTNQLQSTKVLRNGQLLIEKNGKIYNVQGAEVK